MCFPLKFKLSVKLKLCTNLKIGSQRMTDPSTSAKTVAWPIQVARIPGAPN